MQKVEKEPQAQTKENVHSMTVGELLSEVVPGFMEIMNVPMNGKIAYNIGKNWRSLQDLQIQVHAMNTEELRKHVILDSKGEIAFTEQVPGQRPSPKYISDESKAAYFEWYSKFTQETKVDLTYFPVKQEELSFLQNVKPATVTSISFMFHE